MQIIQLNYVGGKTQTYPFPLYSLPRVLVLHGPNRTGAVDVFLQDPQTATLYTQVSHAAFYCPEGRIVTQQLDWTQEVLSVPLPAVPVGAPPLRCFLCGGEVVVTGEPYPVTEQEKASVAHFDCEEKYAAPG